ncbi:MULTISPECIES: hypothetical protein [unclassified Iodidimonas]|jgi:hypothetical protein|uniref:hypothetical protein n=1 Tax=unclassified Iodidimonas TaxID=2626145 RepID=UPI0024827EDC|nr:MULTISPECIES: hypothetical protein [unclassified Iodidimonas]
MADHEGSGQDPVPTSVASILAGPGLIRQPAVIADHLDGVVQEIVTSLEAVANCPSPAFDLPQGLDDAMRLARFCEALGAMGPPIMADYAAQYAAISRAQRFPPDAHEALFMERAMVLIDYFVELAQVHGVAFASRTGQIPPPVVEKTLSSLRFGLLRARDDAWAAIVKP